MKKQKTQYYYVYAQGIYNLWSLVYITTDLTEAREVKQQYRKAKVLKNRMRA
jgi:hypothetical protein